MAALKSRKANMTRTFFLLASLLSVLTFQAALPATASLPVNRMPQDSFLIVPVTTVNGFVNEISLNPRVAARYARLYHLPMPVVIKYFKSYLIVETLPRTFQTPVYCVTPNGSFFIVHKTLNGGVRVFALRSGLPVLQLACGNPFTAKLPFPTTANSNIGGKGKHAAAPETPGYNGQSGNHGQPIQEATNFYQPPSDVFVPNEQVLPYSSTLPDIGPPTDFSVPVTGGFNFGLPLAGIFGGGLFTYLVDHGTPGTSTGLAPVPEGSTYGGFLLGALVLGAGFAFRNRIRSAIDR